ncbi:hypothetical protein [Microvirga zambiensis]|uniref:hypothetical protein n=1 Tax=Microvirga zambiensis TaxID=1402137 RepID=UPI00191D946D|nr:hypothetical protein [Microvirga zambiensis]
MSGIARQFEPQITRSGGAPSKFRFTVHCSDCAATDSYEASRPTSNDAVRGYFTDRGWLLGRAASFDVCPACLARPRDGQKMEPAGQRRETKAMDARQRDTADILARHLGKPEALAAEVFRPRDRQPAPPQARDTKAPPAPSPALSDKAEQTFVAIAADLKGLRAAVELMAAQMSQLVALGRSQIDALANLPPALTQSAEGLSDGLRQVARAIEAFPPVLPPVPDHVTPAEADAGPAQTQAVDAEPAPIAEPQVHELPQRNKGRRTAKNETVASGPADIVVKSISDARGTNRYYTSIRLPRALWDRAGFGSDDRLLLDWSGTALSIERAPEGGVKPKSIGGTTVILQSWKLGNVNLDKPRFTSTSGSLQLIDTKKQPRG